MRVQWSGLSCVNWTRSCSSLSASCFLTSASETSVVKNQIVRIGMASALHEYTHSSEEGSKGFQLSYRSPML